MKMQIRLTLILAATVAAHAPVSAATYEITSLAATGGAATNALWAAPGDAVLLPATGAGAGYQVLNPAVAALEDDGRTLTLDEPGFTGLCLTNAAGTQATGAVVVVPTPAAGGRVFLMHTLPAKNHTVIWNAAGDWSRLAGDAGDRNWPCHSNDIAMVMGYGVAENPLYGVNTSVIIEFDNSNPGTQFIGTLYVGSAVDALSGLRWYGRSGSPFVFSGTDGSPSRIIYTGGSAFDFVFQIGGHLASRAITLAVDGALEVDFGHAGRRTTQRNYLRFSGIPTGLTIPAGSALRFVNANPSFSGSSGTDSAASIGSAVLLSGSGTIETRIQGSVELAYTNRAFTGTFLDTATLRPNYYTGKMGVSVANLRLHRDTAARNRVEIRGFSDYPLTGAEATALGGTPVWGDYDPLPVGIPGAGYVKTGEGGGGLYSGNPDGGLRTILDLDMEGGVYSSYQETDWGSESPVVTRIEHAGFGRGLSRLYAWGAVPGESLAGKAATLISSNHLFIVSMDQRDRGQLLLFHRKLYLTRITGTHASVKLRMEMQDFSEHAIGGIVPWLVAQTRDGFVYPSIDGTCKVDYDNAAAVNLSAAADGSNARVFMTTAGLNLSADKRVNSLVYKAPNATASLNNLGAGRTLTIDSGAMALDGQYTALGTEGGTGNGTLVFGAPAYVMVASNGKASPTGLHTPMVAAEGFALAAYGSVLLTGDQTGIETEFVLNNGRLLLGTTAAPASLKVPVRVVGGGSTLIPRSENVLRRCDVALEDVGGHAPRIELDGTAQSCRTLIVNGKLAATGTVGATGSGAEHVDDVHFAGTGVLTVLQDGSGGTVLCVY